MTDCLVGLDIGTSCVKAGLFTLHGRMLAAASVPVPLYSPQPGWAEQEPEDWWRAACLALTRVLEKLDGNSLVAAVGLSGQCPGHVLVGENQQAIGRAIIWRDQRAQAEAARWLNDHVTPAQAQEWLGTDFAGDASSPLARLLWLKEYRPQDWENARSVLQPKDYVALKLTGQAATDRHSDYCLVNPDSAQYAPALYALLGIDISKLPRPLDPSDAVGEVTPAAGRLTGLKSGTRVICGTIDAYCDNLAGGVTCEGRAVDVAGTSEIVSLHIEQPVQASGIYAARVGCETWFLCGPTQAGGETLRWLAHGFYPEWGQAVNYEALEKEAASAPAGSAGLVFLPYLSGERTPLWDATARGCFFGITFAQTRQHFARAVYEGVGFAIRHILELSEDAAGKKAEEIVVCGGGSRSAFWNQVKADILQRPLRPAVISETGCLGAAILASVGAGLYPDLKEASKAMIELKEAVSPNPSLASVYTENYRIYRQLYPALKPVFSWAFTQR